MRRLMEFRNIILSTLVCVVSAGIPSPAMSDPLPVPEHWMGGRLIPAESVPVDMVSETLTAHLTRHERPQATEPDPHPYFARADVEILYTLRADRALPVPIVFPVTAEPDSVVFTLNGRPLPTRVFSDVDLYSAYEKLWVQAIEGFITADPKLGPLVDEARAPAASRPRGAAQGEAAAPRPDTSSFMRLHSRVLRRLDELRFPNADSLSWALSHYVLDDWDRIASMRHDASPVASARRQKLVATRSLALAFDPTLADPAALWSAAGTGEHPDTDTRREVFFISASLRLKKGDNEFAVRYEQPVSFSNVRYEAPGEATLPGPSHRQANLFEFVLRTARFWRSFGTLDATVYLPPGTVYADCSLPQSRVTLDGQQPTVTCTVTGVPDANLSVAFADFHVISDPRDDNEPFSDEPTGARSVVLSASWDRPLPDGMYYGSVPAVDDAIVVAGGDGTVTVCTRSNGEVLQELHVDGRVRHVLILPGSIIAGLEIRNKGEKPGAGLACFDRNSGAQRWSQTVEGSDYRSYATMPLDAGGQIVAWARGGPVYAVGGASGALLWKQPGEFGGLTLSPDRATAYLAGVTTERREAAPSNERSSLPLAELMAVDIKSGTVKWRRPAGHMCFTPAVWGERLLIVGMKKRYAEPFMACVGRVKGDTVWEKSLPAQTTRYNDVLATQVRDGRLLVVHDSGIDAYDLQSPPNTVWRAGFKYQLHSAPAITDQFVYAPLRIGGLQKFDLETGEMVQEVACARADCSASVDRNELFTLEASGLLTAWSLEGKAAEAALTAGSAWPGTPPADLPQLLASGGTLRAANSWPPFSQADKNGQSMARWLIVSATALAVLLLTAGVAVVRRRRNRK